MPDEGDDDIWGEAVVGDGGCAADGGVLLGKLGVLGGAAAGVEAAGLTPPAFETSMVGLYDTEQGSHRHHRHTLLMQQGFSALLRSLINQRALEWHMYV